MIPEETEKLDRTMYELVNEHGLIAVLDSMIVHCTFIIDQLSRNAAVQYTAGFNRWLAYAKALDAARSAVVEANND